MSLLLAGVVVLISDARVLAHTDLTVEQARDLIASTAGLVVVDVREPSEFCDARGHIPGALNYPLTSGVLQARYAELPMDRPTWWSAAWGA
jgi:3-mercaptopyruvate sulfurtransferase SseA